MLLIILLHVSLKSFLIDLIAIHYSFTGASVRITFLLVFASGAEKEWKLAKNNVEAASGDLASATNELSIASVKAKSASGETCLCEK